MTASMMGPTRVQHASLGCTTRSLRPAAAVARPGRPFCGTARAALANAEMVPDVGKRTTMNLLLLGAASLPVGYMVYGYGALLVPPRIAGAGGGQSAKDAAGNDVKASKWLATHQPGDRSLTQGLKGDATYLIVTPEKEIEKFGLNAVCTHLGCVVPWNQAENKFMCPCHGSQYNSQGKVVRGPAPLSLALTHADIQEDVVFFSPWTETDFRTNTKPWWA